MAARVWGLQPRDASNREARWILIALMDVIRIHHTLRAAGDSGSTDLLEQDLQANEYLKYRWKVVPVMRACQERVWAWEIMTGKIMAENTIIHIFIY